MKTFVFRFCLALSLILVNLSSVSLAAEVAPTGNDVSWPNCNTSIQDNGWGVVGVNGGLIFKSSTCTFKESSHFSNFALYMNTGYPGFNYAVQYWNNPRICQITNQSCLAYNFGYQAAEYALKSAALQGVHSNFWWLDVETVNSWSSKVALNKAELAGMVKAIKANALFSNIGYYSDSTQWKTITGGWKNKYPTWLATGLTSSLNVPNICKIKSFTGGKVLLVQYTEKLDINYLCDQSFVTNLRNY